MAGRDKLYDVFLCHNSRDKVDARTINERLRQEYGLRTYLDEATLVGGEAWERSIQAALAGAATCAVIVGPNGWGPYQRTHEVEVALRLRDTDPTFRVIPVLLGNADADALKDATTLFSQIHRVTFEHGADDPPALRSLAFAIRGENAFPEGLPQLTASRVRFDAIRWDTGGRRDDSVLYAGHILRQAVHLLEHDERAHEPLLEQFLTASRRHHEQRLAEQLAAEASVLWNDERQRDLAARLALESVRRSPTAEALNVLRQAGGHLQTTRADLHHPAPVLAGVAHPGGSRLATGCENGAVCLFDGESLVVLGAHPSSVRAAVDLGERFATAGADGTVMLWEWSTGAPVGRFGVGESIQKLQAGRSDGRAVLLTSGGVPGQPGLVSVWGVDGDEPEERWRFGMVTDAVLDADRPNVVLGWGDHVALRRLEDGTLGARLPMGQTVIGVAAHPAVPWVAATTFATTAHLISFESDPPEQRLLGDHISRISPVQISPDGRWIAAVRDDFHVVLWDLAHETTTLLRSEGLLGIVPAFSDRNRYVGVVSPEASTITFWRSDSGRHVCTVEQDRPVFALFDDERNRVWVAGHGTSASLVVLPSQTEALAVASPGLTSALAFSPDGRTLGWVGTPVADDLMVRPDRYDLVVVDVISATMRIDAELTEPATVAFDDGGTKVAAAGATGVRVWDLTTGAEEPPSDEPFWGDRQPRDDDVVSTLREQPAVVAVIGQRGFGLGVSSPDGRFVAIDHGQRLVSLWSVDDATEITTFSMGGDVTMMAFSPTGSRFAGGDDRGAVTVWQTDGTPLGSLQHAEPISHLVFNPDGSFLAVASVDLAVNVWVVDPTLLAGRVAGLVSGPLTPAQWSRYLGDEPPPAD